MERRDSRSWLIIKQKLEKYVDSLALNEKQKYSQDSFKTLFEVYDLDLVASSGPEEEESLDNLNSK